ncbi:ATP-binding protein [Kitasatospora sp. NPDC053057]|uniref:ATP-binding protein n=1 Tax=Kitasatospora sp. NPDC053057 TaxID=3364062 RepID=UPI0037C7E336
MSGVRESQARYQRHPSAVKAARFRAAELTEEWGLQPHADDVQLILSEVLTNAVRHGAGRQVAVSYHLDAARLRVEVRDQGDAIPCPRSADGEAEDGRGLMIVQGLASRWGVNDRVIGKAVWFEIDVPPVPATNEPSAT